MRMLMNNLDPAVAEHPEELIVYGGGGKAARNWEAYHRIIATLQRLENDETLIVQSGKPVGVFRTHEEAPRHRRPRSRRRVGCPRLRNRRGPRSGARHGPRSSRPVAGVRAGGRHHLLARHAGT